MIKIFEADLTGNEQIYLSECVASGWISSQGRFVAEFEKMVLRDIVDRECLATANGTVALHLALVALGVGPGDEVIVPDITFGATLNAVLYAGAVPVIVDIDPNDWNISREFLDSALTDKTKAILPVALYGNPSGISEIVDWASTRDIFSIVDAAEAVGAKIGGKDIGTFGDAVTYSYFGNKIITTGEGGAVVFKNKEVASLARVLRDHGMTPGRRYHHEVIGFNYRMTNMQAAVGVAQYERLDSILDVREKIIKRYHQNIASLSLVSQAVSESCKSSNWVFAVSVPCERIDSIMMELSNQDIEHRRCFEPMSLQPAFTTAKVSSSLESSQALFNSLLLLPTHSRLSFGEIDHICEVVIEKLDRKSR